MSQALRREDKFNDGLVCETASKHDLGKAPLSLIPVSALLEEAAVMGYGEKKYGRDNWRNGMHWSRALDAAQRHILAFQDGEDFDPETGLHHLAHARCNMAFLIEYALTHPELDDRHKSMPPHHGR